MARQEFHTIDHLTLEVQDGWPDLPNLVPNPSGSGGAWGWRTGGAGHSLIAPVATFTLSGTSLNAVAYSDPIHITEPSGKQIRGSVRFIGGSSGASLSLRVERASDPDSLWVTVATVNMSSGGDYAIPVTSIASSSNWLRVRVEVTGPSAGVWADFSRVILMCGTPAEIADSDPLTAPGWVDVLAPSHDIRITREPLNTGSLSAVIRDADLDPAVSDLIRPGKRVRLSQGTQRLFVGKIADASVTYALKDPNIPESKRARIELAAVDPLADLANQRRDEGVLAVADLPYVLLGTGVPWNLNGSSAAIDPETVEIVSRNDNATALDQVALTRDSVLGHGWMSRAGVLNVYDADQMLTTSTTLTTADYSDLGLDFDTGRCINEVSIDLQRINPGTGESETVTYGPYRNEESIRQWGVHSATFTVHGLEGLGIGLYAHHVLTANATPERRVNYVTVPIRTAADMPKALIDLYDLITVETAQGDYEGLRVTRLEHHITPNKWLLTLGFEIDGSVASPTVIPSPSGSSGGKTMAQLLRPVGEVTMWFGAKTDVPAGWLPLDGSTFDADAFPDLAALLGSTTLPDYTDRMPIGAGTKALGSAGGSPTANIPAHTHGNGSLSAASPANEPGVTDVASGTNRTRIRPAEFNVHTHNVTGTTASGGAATIDTMPPWRAIWFLIRAV